MSCVSDHLFVGIMVLSSINWKRYQYRCAAHLDFYVADKSVTHKNTNKVKAKLLSLLNKLLPGNLKHIWWAVENNVAFF